MMQIQNMSRIKAVIAQWYLILNVERNMIFHIISHIQLKKITELARSGKNESTQHKNKTESQEERSDSGKAAMKL